MTTTSQESDTTEAKIDDARAVGSLLGNAKKGDTRAIVTLFKQFVPPDEHIEAVDYLGVQGVWGLGTHSFACVTSRRVAGLRTKIFGEVTYQDAALEHVNSGVIYQPSRFWLYVFVIGSAFLTAGFSLLLLPLTVRLFYRFKKSGLVLWVREGIPVYIFSDRKRLINANRLYRTALALRENRIAETREGTPPLHPVPAL